MLMDILENPNPNPKIPKTTNVCEVDDRFSNLPEPIIHKIFSSLETIDIIRLSAVSRRWRYLWLSMPYLNLDIDTVWSDAEAKWSINTIIDKFKDFVNWVLMSQDVSINLKTFRLWCYHRGGDHTLYRWINIVARRNVEELDLNMYSLAPFELPHCLVTCESLLVLKLNFDFHCAVKLPTFVGFSRLNALEFVRIDFSDSNLFRNFISSCPLLENLSMEACIFRDFRILDISRASLKSLTINNGAEHNCDGLENCELKVACPNLATFIFIGPSAADYLLEGLNPLKNVYIYLDSKFEAIDTMEYYESNYKILKLLEGVCQTEVLRLSYGDLECLQFTEELAMPAKWFPVSFYNLKTLTMMVGAIEKHIFSLLCNAPNLETLKMYLGECDYDEWEMPDEAFSCLKFTLKTVELFEVAGCQNELELVRYLLKYGGVLQKMNINWVKSLENAEEIISKITMFPRSSSAIELTYAELLSDVYFYQL
ncbi:hypothetical protein Patl1_00090 [Pistacia atlantica]|uniref:Uncharacterized protein n=1 Tax=Pistacia atlantica TaxID=434234 RepID=A0ACC1C5V4_9ROSI|nr:hypothetical protein Patl1_00090 [Pistacia atlantica]